jgi:hypothetical protein
MRVCVANAPAGKNAPAPVEAELLPDRLPLPFFERVKLWTIIIQSDQWPNKANLPPTRSQKTKPGICRTAPKIALYFQFFAGVLTKK